MKKLMIAFAAVAAFGTAFAQNAAAPAPESTSQGKCAIEEKDVDAMMDTYLSEKRPAWTPGLNTKADGSKFFISVGRAAIKAPRNHKNYINSRVLAFNKAMLDAKAQMAEYLGAEILTETSRAIAEGAAARPAPLTETDQVADKLKQLMIAKLNKKLADEGIDPVTDPAKAKSALGEIVNSDEMKKFASVAARAEMIGIQACCSFEGTPAGKSGQIGVIAIWSPKLQAMAASILTGAPVPQVGAKVPVAQQISSDPATLISTFGVQQKIDESGDLVLVSFGQAGAASESDTSAEIARDKARIAAMAALREFAGEQVAVATDVLNAESTTEFENAGEEYVDESSYQKKIRAAAARMNISGIAPLKTYKFPHPINGKTVYGCIVTWCPKQAGQARMLKRTMANPTATSSALRPKPVTPAASAVPARGFNATGQGADPDAL